MMNLICAVIGGVADPCYLYAGSTLARPLSAIGADMSPRWRAGDMTVPGEVEAATKLGALAVGRFFKRYVRVIRG